MATGNRIAEHCRRILRWLHTYPLPPEGFDATTASDRALAEFGLPARPDERLKDGGPFKFWRRMIGPGTLYRTPRFPDGSDARELRIAYERHGQPTSRDAGRAMPAFNHRSNSRNWSGACITPIRPNRITYVAGAWTVPRARMPDILPSGANRLNENYHSSTWVGIGGNRPYNSLPQIGTGQHVKVTGGLETEEYFAWWQWWVKDRPEHHVPIPITNLGIEAGNSMLASVTIEASNDVVFHLKNESTSEFATFRVVAPDNIEALGASAEWIHERPTEFDSDRMYPLPSCEKVSFTDCRAASAPVPGGPETWQTLLGARLIRMTDVFDNPNRSVVVSTPILDGCGLSIRYSG